MRSDITAKQAEIDQENAKAARNSDGTRQQALDQIAGLQQSTSVLQQELIAIDRSLTEKMQAGQTRAAEFGELRASISQAQREVEEAQGHLQHMTREGSSSLAAFGPGVQQLIKEIAQEGRWRDKPMGPLGSFVKLKDQRWSRVVESVLDRTFMSYLVTNPEDEMRLRQLMKRCNV
jgi:chromosome segregation ATPase